MGSSVSFMSRMALGSCLKSRPPETVAYSADAPRRDRLLIVSQSALARTRFSKSARFLRIALTERQLRLAAG
jgi:hypothetical protein